jgi:hypothetical protein
MAEPLTKPRFDAQIDVNKPVTADEARPSPTAAQTLDPVHELPAAHRIHRVQGRQVWEPKSKILEVASNIQENASAAYERIATVADDVVCQAQQKAADALRRARNRARHILDDCPLHVIGAVASAAFVAGALLRIWRSNHE